MDELLAEAIVHTSGDTIAPLVLSGSPKWNAGIPQWITARVGAASKISIFLWSLSAAMVILICVLGFVNSSPSIPAGWRLVHSDGGFSVLMPVDAKEGTHTQWMDGHSIVINYVMTKDTGRDCAFVTAYMGLDFATGNNNFDNNFDTSLFAGAFGATLGTVLSRSTVRVDGHDGTEIVSQTADGHTKTARIFGFSNRVYIILLVTGSQHSADADVRGFLPSFHFDN